MYSQQLLGWIKLSTSLPVAVVADLRPEMVALVYEMLHHFSTTMEEHNKHTILNS